MSTITRARRRWTGETIDSALQQLIAELGRFPSRAELVARGQRGRWEAMRNRGGVDRWRQQAEAAAGSRVAEPISYQRVAARAYQLYQQGQPGDAISYWFTAEAQLSVAV
jgi:hypothetical protein